MTEDYKEVAAEDIDIHGHLKASQSAPSPENAFQSVDLKKMAAAQNTASMAVSAALCETALCVEWANAAMAHAKSNHNSCLFAQTNPAPSESFVDVTTHTEWACVAETMSRLDTQLLVLTHDINAVTTTATDLATAFEAAKHAEACQQEAIQETIRKEVKNTKSETNVQTDLEEVVAEGCKIQTQQWSSKLLRTTGGNICLMPGCLTDATINQCDIM